MLPDFRFPQLAADDAQIEIIVFVTLGAVEQAVRNLGVGQDLAIF